MRPLPSTSTSGAAFGLVAALLCGCAVGPDYHPPPAPTVSGFTREPPGPAFGPGKDLPGRWWTLFGSTQLDALVDRALKANPDLESARAALRGAHETYLAQWGALLPSAEADYSVTRQQASGTPAPPLASNNNLFTLQTAQVTVSYAPDVFGGVRRQVETARAQAEAQRFETEAAYLTLTANVVAGAIQEGALTEETLETRRAIKAETDVLRSLERQKALGQSSGLDVAAQETALTQTEALLPPLEKQLAQQRDQMAYLTGRAPAEVDDTALDLKSLTFPADLPVSLPSKLVEQRPDIRAAEANLHAASAQVGVAIANRLPGFALTATAGGASTSLSNLFSQGNGLWGLTAQATQPIFQGGTLLHRQRAAEAALDQAKAQYRAAVLAAFQNVADAMQALDADKRALDAAQRAQTSADATLRLTRRQLDLGQVNGAAVLLAEQADEQATAARVQAEAERYADAVALFQALGGGWWNRKDV